MSRSLLRIAAFAAAVAHIAAAKGAVAAAEEEVLLGEGSCTRGFTFSGFTETRLNGDYIAVYGIGVNPSQQQPTYHKDSEGIAHSDYRWNWPYGITITSQTHYENEKHYIPGKSWSIFYNNGVYQGWDVLLAWCVPGVDGCPEISETGLWPSSVGLIKWNVVVDLDLNPDVEHEWPPPPPNKTTLNSGVSASCCEWTPDECASCNCDQKIVFGPTCNGPLSSESCRKDCCEYTWIDSVPWGYHVCRNTGGKSGGLRHCKHSSGLITEASAVSKQPEFTV